MRNENGGGGGNWGFIEHEEEKKKLKKWGKNKSAISNAIQRPEGNLEIL